MKVSSMLFSILSAFDLAFADMPVAILNFATVLYCLFHCKLSRIDEGHILQVSFGSLLNVKSTIEMYESNVVRVLRIFTRGYFFIYYFAALMTPKTVKK